MTLDKRKFLRNLVDSGKIEGIRAAAVEQKYATTLYPDISILFEDADADPQEYRE